MFSLSLHEASLRRPSRPVTSHGTAPCRDWVAFPFSTRAMQGTRSTDSGRGATRGRAYSLPIKNIVVGLPHPAVPGDCRTSDANRSYARSLKPTWRTRPADRPHPLDPRGGGNARTSRAPGRSLRRRGVKSREKPRPALPSRWANARDAPWPSASWTRGGSFAGFTRLGLRVWSAQRRTTSDTRSECQELFGKTDDKMRRPCHRNSLRRAPEALQRAPAPRHGPDHALDHEERNPKSKRMPTANVGQDDRFVTGLRRCPGQVSGQNALHSGVHKQCEKAVQTRHRTALRAMKNHVGLYRGHGQGVGPRRPRSAFARQAF